ncbi:MAG TPA: polysaccharide biosynthesis/export family protein [Kofleriaceae bacterium]|nr:polysaccharide biosynthesis/export family protein [Kofleriaceae bacterium]
MRAVLVLMPVFLLLAAAGCPAKNYDYPYNKEPDPRNKELVLGVGDTISINVWEQKDLNTEATIRADGTITMPLVGDLKAAGETPSALKAQISKRIQDFVKLAPGNSELVTIAVKEWRSYRFRVQGEVVRQGVFTSDHFVTVADAIAMAGGVTRFAKRQEVKLFREDKQTRQTKEIPINYDLIANGSRLDMNIYLLPDDTIYVP